MTQEEIKLVATGFGHMVDNGYNKLESIDDVIKVLEVSMHEAIRESNISKIWRMNTDNADAIAEFLKHTINNIKARAAR